MTFCATCSAAFLLAVGLLGEAGSTAAQDVQPVEADGPYVSILPDGWRADSVRKDGDVRRIDVAAGVVTVSAAGSAPAFEVALRPPPEVAASIEPLASGTPLLVLADTHGEYAILVAFLKAQGVIDAQLRWTFGNGHLAVAGDMLDRGAHQIEILWLLYKLEAEARAAGGRLHVLIGNHEALVLRGDRRYLNPRYPEVASRLGVTDYAQLLGPDTVLGVWLRSHPAMLKLGDLLIVHGGVSPHLTESSLDLDAVNAIVRRFLDVPYAVKPLDGSLEALVLGENGPLWYRGYFPMRESSPTATDAAVTASFDRFDVSRILVGHTVVERVSALYDGKVIAVQVYPHEDEATGQPILEGALRLDGVWFRATAQGERLPLDLED
ncbi:Protein-tyrosine-phosphatase [Brevundimonas diminuta 3F5N]|uniref:Protein-tyrosine-phosphatase n=1 Tax=Brevundimonas diminuta 3F5N TaxID=1255603 RepID=A0A1R4FNW0_BREDI|nr:metallophosphoesterase [Brevundimonas diminuta]SJM57720.1 Protein-tyrosine-phosphatase [Brevundimonas diminuta 3F5N]